MAFHQILSDDELKIAPDGLYYVAGDDGGYIESDREGATVRLMARVRDEAELPKGAQGVIVRADGKQIITEWVNANLVDAVIADAPVAAEAVSRDEPPSVEAVRCPLCGAALTNRLIQSVTVCPSCGTSIALVEAGAVQATSTHTVPLTETERQMLREEKRIARGLPKNRFRVGA